MTSLHDKSSGQVFRTSHPDFVSNLCFKSLLQVFVTSLRKKPSRQELATSLRDKSSREFFLRGKSSRYAFANQNRSERQAPRTSLPGKSLCLGYEAIHYNKSSWQVFGTSLQGYYFSLQVLSTRQVPPSPSWQVLVSSLSDKSFFFTSLLTRLSQVFWQVCATSLSDKSSQHILIQVFPKNKSQQVFVLS